MPPLSQALFGWFYLSLFLLVALVWASHFFASDPVRDGRSFGERFPRLCTVVLVNFALAALAMCAWVAAKTN